MTDRLIVDAGPLVAFLDVRDAHHQWATAAFERRPLPLITCEAAIVEAAYLLRHWPVPLDRLLDWVEQGTLSIEFELADDIGGAHGLLRTYRDQPMSLADACLVRMAEGFADHAICTLDSDFRVYRTSKGAPLKLVIPDAA